MSVKRDRESNLLNTDTEGTIESVHINGVFALNGFLSQGTKKTFRNRPLARWRHFTTTTRILRGLAFLCKLGDWHLILAGITKFKYKRKTVKDSGRSGKMTPSQMAFNEESLLSECPRVKRGLTVCKKLKQVRHMNAMNFSTCKSY